MEDKLSNALAPSKSGAGGKSRSGSKKPRQKKIAVLTSGGDSAGMNAAVRAVVRMGIARGCQAYIIREGWEGLVRGNNTEVPSDDVPTPTASQTPTPALSRSTSHVHLPPSQRIARHNKATERNQYFNEAGEPLGHLSYGFGELLLSGSAEGEIEADGLEEQRMAVGSGATGGVPEATGVDAKKTLKGTYIVRVGWDDVRGWLGEGGTLIGSSRCPSFRTREGRLKAAQNLIEFGIDCLAVCGGDGSLTGADMLRKEWPSLVGELLENQRITKVQAETFAHLNIVGLVGSIDNDMAMTDLTIGGLTALHRICEAVDSISSTASSHSRAFVVEVMGRHCGWLALLAGIATGADYIFIPEQPPKSDNWEEEMCSVLKAHRQVGKRKSIVIVAEGALDKNLNPIKGDYIKDVLVDKLGLDTRVTTLGHTQRGGAPCAYDRILATLQGVEAVEALLSATPDTPSYMIGISENKITRKPLLEAVAQTQAVAVAIEEKNFDKAMSFRDPEFAESLQAFKASSTLDDSLTLPVEKRLRIGIIHVGAPAGGMNAATRQAVRYCLARGHTPIGIQNGFNGLLDDAVQELSWLRVDNWTTRGGSELGTNRTLPDVDLGGIAASFQAHSFDALLMVGGFEALLALEMLEGARKHYPSFQIPMVHLPATLSNNVPLTEHSLGSDTSLNALVAAADAIRQSASASRNRVFIVETQGGMSGYIATMGAMAVGAVLCYTPENGINLDVLQEDVDFLKKRYALDVPGKSEGRLVIRRVQKSSKIYTTEVMTKIFAEEGKNIFDSRSASLGHTLQGGVPSPYDRTRAARLSLRCMQFLESQAHKAPASGSGKPSGRRQPCNTRDSAASITIQGSQIIFTPIDEMLAAADIKNRRGKSTWWKDMKELVELMGGRTGIVNENKRDKA
ncbi:6-phosphofructokinase [Filobasidium floriforme]|uniref:6-phosphofructokinase n=1 Tax=Filobasidium floriforme TaxID=5210 RepID=UPI001E8E931F|nr:6-phosphofructokinase [Filobasidium floriforme]KAH8089320.1 6-phosphofructokinase [Filobasidium floriforme]